MVLQIRPRHILSRLQRLQSINVVGKISLPLAFQLLGCDIIEDTLEVLELLCLEDAFGDYLSAFLECIEGLAGHGPTLVQHENHRTPFLV